MHRREVDAQFAREPACVRARSDATAGRDGYESAATAATAFEETGTRTAVICSSDDRYAEMVPELAAALKERGAELVLVAGDPRSFEGVWRRAGVDGFLFDGCNAVSVLEAIQRTEGVDDG